MCPPIEMFGEQEREREVEQDQRADARPHGSIPRARCITNAARHQAEHRARGADRERVGLEQQRAERAAEQRREVERGEAHVARAPARASCPSQYRMYMLKRDVEQAGVQEAAGDQPPVLAVGHADRRRRARADRAAESTPTLPPLADVPR